MATNNRIKTRQRMQRTKEARKEARFDQYYLRDFPAHLRQERSAKVKNKG